MNTSFLRFIRALKGYSQMEESKLLSESEHICSPPGVISRRSFDQIELLARLACCLIFVGGAMMLLAAVYTKQSDKDCAAQLSIWFLSPAPVLDAVEYEERDWVNIFSTHSGFVGTPTSELEEKWHKLVDVPTVLIPPERIPFLNRSIEQGFVEANPPAPHGYIATVEVFHHLHCLNVVRQYATRDRYPEGLVPTILKYNSPAVAVAHVDHCIEVLRTSLTCNADLTPYLWYKEPNGGDGAPREDFQATHKCKRFDRILDWVKENGVVPATAVKRNVGHNRP
ncbi:MAG: hypothetical protein Q9214_002801 [Letrouitia sp. 1 TL-2023]